MAVLVGRAVLLFPEQRYVVLYERDVVQREKSIDELEQARLGDETDRGETTPPHARAWATLRSMNSNIAFKLSLPSTTMAFSTTSDALSC